MPAVFIGSSPGNFHQGRPAGFMPEAIVLHRTGGSRGSIRARFNDPAALASAHYLVCRDGTVEQYVLEADAAFHAGLVVGPTWPRLRPRVNPNFYTIGIELEGSQADPWPDPQVEATGNLVAEIAGRWQFPIDAGHVIPHSAIRAPSRCPGDGLPLAHILELARGRTLAPRRPHQTVVRTLVHANVRQGAPSRHAPIVHVIPAGTDVAVTRFTDAGDRVQGNPFWYALEDDRFVWAGATDIPAPTEDDRPQDDAAIVSETTDAMELARRPPPGPSDTVRVDVPIDRTTLVLPAKEFVGEVTRKNLIVLHFTAGTTARSAFDTWRRDPLRIATSYIVDVDGTIYEVFPPTFWAAHLGIKGTNNVHDRRSIGIEIANVGPLQRSSEDPSVLNWWPPKSKGAPEFTTKFCNLDETDRYVTAAYRTKNHFASFPAVQVDAAGALIRGLCEQFSIPATLPPIGRRFECDVTRFATYTGVCTHANFRRDKWDIGPAFPWDRLGL